MRSITCWMSTLFLVLFAAAGASRAERPPETKKDATDIVTGIVQKITPREEKIGRDGVLTTYTAELKVDSVEKGKDIQKGATVKFFWIHITKRPSGGFVGAFGHKYNVRPKDKVRVWLVKRDKDYEVIYNTDGIEPLKKSGQ